MTMEHTDQFEITQLTPELRRLLEIIKKGRDHTAHLLSIIAIFDPVEGKNSPVAVLGAGIFGVIGNVMNAITNSMPEETKQEALKIVYDESDLKPEPAMVSDLELGGSVMTHLLIRSLMKAAKDGKLGEIKENNPELLNLLTQLGAPDIDPQKGAAEAAKEYFDGISDKDFADAELKMGGYVGPTGKHNN